MKRYSQLAALIIFLFSTLVVYCQQYPPLLLIDGSGNPYPSGSGSPLGSNPPIALCYTDVTGLPLPCDFSGTGTPASLAYNVTVVQP